MRTASSENQRKNSAAYVISALDSASGLPISSVISSASSSLRLISVSNARRRISPRSRGGCFPHSGWIAQQASSAPFASSGGASATLVSTSPVEGASTSSAAPPGASPPPPP